MCEKNFEQFEEILKVNTEATTYLCMYSYFIDFSEMNER